MSALVPAKGLRVRRNSGMQGVPGQWMQGLWLSLLPAVLLLLLLLLLYDHAHASPSATSWVRCSWVWQTFVVVPVRGPWSGSAGGTQMPLMLVTGFAW
jgi:hypothetical protein